MKKNKSNEKSGVSNRNLFVQAMIERQGAGAGVHLSKKDREKKRGNKAADIRRAIEESEDE